MPQGGQYNFSGIGKKSLNFSGIAKKQATPLYRDVLSTFEDVKEIASRPVNPRAALGQRVLRAIVGGIEEAGGGVSDIATAIKDPSLKNLINVPFGAMKIGGGMVGVAASPFALAEEAFEPIDKVLDFAVENHPLWRQYSGLLTPEQRETAKNTLKIGAYVSLGAGAKTGMGGIKRALNMTEISKAVDTGVADFVRSQQTIPVGAQELRPQLSTGQRQLPVAASGGERFRQAPGFPPVDTRAGVPVPKTPPLLPQKATAFPPGVSPTTTFQVGETTVPVKSVPPGVTSRRRVGFPAQARNTQVIQELNFEGIKRVSPKEAETVGIPKSFRNKMKDELGIARETKLPDAELTERYQQAGLDKPAPLSEAPISRGGSMEVRGEANQAQIERTSGEFAKIVKTGISRWMDEVRGQDILDRMSESGIKPQDVGIKFWEETYFKLPEEVQARFKEMFKRQAGFTLEDVLKREGSIRNFLDLGNDPLTLEGTERGYVVLMEEANRRYSGEVRGPANQAEIEKVGGEVPLKEQKQLFIGELERAQKIVKTSENPMEPLRNAGFELEGNLLVTRVGGTEFRTHIDKIAEGIERAKKFPTKLELSQEQELRGLTGKGTLKPSPLRGHLTWSGAARETAKRHKERFSEPPKGETTFEMGGLGRTKEGLKDIKYVIDPLLDVAKRDAVRAINSGSLAASEFPKFVSTRINALLSEHPEFRSLSTEQKRAMFKAAMDAAREAKYIPHAQEFRSQEGQKARAELQAEAGSDLVKGRLVPETVKAGLVDPLDVYTDGVGKLAAKQFRTLGEYVREQPGGGDLLFRDVNRVYRNSAQWAGRLEKKVREPLRKLSESEFQEFIEMSDAGIESKNPKVIEAFKAWDEVRTELAGAAQKANMLVVRFTKDRMDFEKIPFSPRKHFFPHEWDITEIMSQKFRNRFVESFADRQGLPRAMAEDIFNKWIRTRIERKYGHLEYARDFDMPGWKRSRDVVVNYIERATRRIEEAKTFGENYAIAENWIEQIRQNGGDYQYARLLFDRVVGRDNFNRTWFEAQRQINDWQAATKLTLLSLLNWTQLNNAGLIAGWKGIARSFGEIFKGNWKDVKEFADLNGSVLNSTLNMHLREISALDGIAAKVMHWTGVTMQERLMRTLSSNMVAREFNTQVAKLNKKPNPRLRAELERKIKYLALDKDVSLDAAIKREAFTEKELLDIGYEAARKTQFLSRPQDLPPLLSNKNYRVFTLFKSFISQQTKLVYEAVVKEAQHGNFKPLAYLLTMFPIAGEIAQDLRSLVTGRKRPDNILERIVEDFATVGALGVVYDMLQSAMRGQEGLMRWMAGPTISELSSLGYGIGKAAEGDFKPLGRFAVRQIPIPILQQQLMRQLNEKKKTRGITP